MEIRFTQRLPSYLDEEFSDKVLDEHWRRFLHYVQDALDDEKLENMSDARIGELWNVYLCGVFQEIERS